MNKYIICNDCKTELDARESYKVKRYDQSAGSDKVIDAYICEECKEVEDHGRDNPQ